MTDRLSVSTMGFRSSFPVVSRSLCIATMGFRCAVTVQPQDAFVSVGGGSRPLVPVPPTYVQLPLQVSDASVDVEDLRRRARTLAASVGVVVEDGDRAKGLAATIALLLDELKNR